MSIKPVTGMNYRDIDQWFRGGVVLAPVVPDGQPVLCSFIGTNEDTTAVVVPVNSPTGAGVTVPYMSVQGVWPLCGSVNVPDYSIAVQVNRLTTKQYRRTINPSCVSIDIPRRWEVMQFLGRTGRARDLALSFDLVARACCLAEYPSFEEACRRLDTGEWFSVAITRRIIVAGDPSGKRIFYYDGEAAASSFDGQLYPMGDGSVINRIIKATGEMYRGTQCY